MAVCEALRPDLEECLTDEARDWLRRRPRTRAELDPELYAEEILGGLFQIVHAPPRMFEFEAFRRLMVRYIIPSQLLRQDANFFNPYDLATFGIP